MAGVFGALVALQSAPVVAQDWEVWGYGNGLTLDQDEDDGLNGEGEVILSIQWTHVDQERGLLTALATTATTWHNWDDSGSTLGGLVQQLETQECDDSDHIFVSARLNESDMYSSFDTLLATAAGIVVGITVATVLAPTGPGSPIAGVMAAKVAGAVVGTLTGFFLKSFDGVEDLGSVEGKRLEYGDNDFDLSGPDGSGSIRIEDRSFQTTDFDLPCYEGKGSNPPVDPVDPDTAVDGIFPEILSALAEVPTLDREDATGPSIDPEILNFRRSANELLVAFGEVAATYFVFQTQTGYQGASAALPLLASGRVHHAAGEYVQAVEDYREAFRTAYTAVWNGNFGPDFVPDTHLTLLGSVRLVSAGSYHEFFGWAQGLSWTEYVDHVSVDGQSAGMVFASFPGVARTAVVLAGNLPPDFETNSLIGLGRITGGVIEGPDATCNVDHLEEGSVGGGILIDEQGPYFEPDPSGCGYGEVISTYLDLRKGGVPAGASPDTEGIFTVALEVTDEIQAGEYDLTVTAHIEDTGGGGGWQVSAPLTLLVAPPNEIFADGFESGDTSAWN